jgi:hypothetical protein
MANRSLRMWLSLGGWVGASVFVACAGSPAQPYPDGGTAGPAGTTSGSGTSSSAPTNPPACLGEGGCSDPYACDANTQACGTRASCNSDSDCPEHFACGIDKLCLLNCREVFLGYVSAENSNCQSGYVCNSGFACVSAVGVSCSHQHQASDCHGLTCSTIDDQCVAPKSCQLWSDCDPGYACAGTTCSEGCLQGCAPGYQCDANSEKCVAVTASCNPVGNQPGSFGGTPALQICHGPLCDSTNTCKPAQACKQDSDCANGFACDGSSYACVVDCREISFGCAVGYRCSSTGACVATKSCSTWADCDPGYGCDESNLCYESCGGTTECTPGFTCDPTSMACTAVTVSCDPEAVDSGVCNGPVCDQNQVCEAPQFCRQDSDCSAGHACSTSYNVCVPDCRETNGQCPLGTTCNTSSGICQ